MHAIPADANQVPEQQQERSRVWWLALGALACVQLLAFWMVCSHQVQMAEARSNEAAMQQMALSDCLQYIPGSTVASCTSQLESARAAQASGGAAVSATLPVSFTYR